MYVRGMGTGVSGLELFERHSYKWTVFCLVVISCVIGPRDLTFGWFCLCFHRLVELSSGALVKLSLWLWNVSNILVHVLASGRNIATCINAQVA